MRKPPPQQNAATTPAFRGPSRSAQRPNTAADEPRNTKNSVNIHPSVLIFQSPGADAVIPMARDNGSQKTLQPYPMPIDRWMARAAGGTSQRLKPGPAMVRSLDNSPEFTRRAPVDGGGWANDGVVPSVPLESSDDRARNRQCAARERRLAAGLPAAPQRRTV